MDVNNPLHIHDIYTYDVYRGKCPYCNERFTPRQFYCPVCLDVDLVPHNHTPEDECICDISFNNVLCPYHDMTVVVTADKIESFLRQAQGLEY